MTEFLTTFPTDRQPALDNLNGALAGLATSAIPAQPELRLPLQVAMDSEAGLAGGILGLDEYVAAVSEFAGAAEPSTHPRDSLSQLLIDLSRGLPGSGPEVISIDTSFVVGSEINAGTYVAFYASNCYWERLDSTGEIIDNNFVTDAPRVEVSIQSGDFAFNSEDCAPWVRIG